MVFDVGPVAAFFAGILSVSSPCVLPLIPAIMAYSVEKGKWRPVLMVLGLALTFTLMGIMTSLFGMVIGKYLMYLKVIGALLIIFLGATMLFELGFFNRFAGLINVRMTNDKSGPLGSVALGASLGIVWIPCVGPILGTILTMVALQGDVAYGGFLLFIYSMGLGLPMLALAYVVNLSSDKLRRATRYDALIKRIAGAILVYVGIYLLWGMVHYSAPMRWFLSLFG